MGEVETVLAQHHGYNYTGDDRVHTLGDKGELESTTAGVVNNTRVTGRIEPPYEERDVMCGWCALFVAAQ